MARLFQDTKQKLHTFHVNISFTSIPHPNLLVTVQHYFDDEKVYHP